ncbi:MAG: efflux RND transporter periplasmic adaptor subunit [Pirellulaceae bacterium]
MVNLPSVGRIALRDSRDHRSGRSDARPRGGNILFFVLAGLAVASVTIGVLVTALRRTDDSASVAPLTAEVRRGPYKYEVLEQGEVESSNNVEIRCEVRARNSMGPSTSIIDVIREGTQVKKGDWLVTFDSSTLELERSQQRIVANTSEALVIQAKALYDTAVIAKKEYMEGAYKEQEKTILNQIFVAEETLKKAELSYESIKRLVSRGLLNSLQLEGEQFRVDAARNDLDLAKRKLEVLEKYTQQKMLTQLESDIKAAEVKWRNEQNSFQEELNKLRDIEDQITKCRVTAPQDGQVVYANIQSSRSGSEFVVEPGAMVRERQAIIRLPDPGKMQVKAKIAESRISSIQEGMPVSIRIDAFGDNFLLGQVSRVNKYAEPGNWWSSTAKEYATIIQIADPPSTLRVGLTAEVRILVEDREDALQIPVQAVYERFGKTFCLVQNGDEWDTREIIVSSTNDKMVAIDEAQSEPLQEDELIVLNPRKHLDLMDSSKLPQQPPAKEITKDDEAKLAVMKAERDLANQQSMLSSTAGKESAKKKKQPTTEPGGGGGSGVGLPAGAQ